MNLVLYEELAIRVPVPSLDQFAAWGAELARALELQDNTDTMLCFFVALCSHHHGLKESASFPSPTVTSPLSIAPTTTLLPLLVERIKGQNEWQVPSTVFALKAVNALVQRASDAPPCVHDEEFITRLLHLVVASAAMDHLEEWNQQAVLCLAILNDACFHDPSPTSRTTETRVANTKDKRATSEQQVAPARTTEPSLASSADKSEEMLSDPSTKRRVLLHVLSTQKHAWRALGESVLFLLNRFEAAAPRVLLIKFCYTLLTDSPDLASLFFVNDLKVLLDLCLRELNDLPGFSPESENLRQAYLRLMIPLMTQTGYFTSSQNGSLSGWPRYKMEQVVLIAQHLLQNVANQKQFPRNAWHTKMTIRLERLSQRLLDTLNKHD